MTTMTVTFPGGKRVAAHFKGFTIQTDQSPRGGGEGSAPEPFDLFLASVATCVGVFAKSYCDTRGIATAGLGVEMRVARDEERHRVASLTLEIKLPTGFPDKHRDGILRAAELCTVKKHIFEPPAFEIRAI